MIHMTNANDPHDAEGCTKGGGAQGHGRDGWSAGLTAGGMASERQRGKSQPAEECTEQRKFGHDGLQQSYPPQPLRLLDEMPVKRGSMFRDHIVCIARERLAAKIAVLTKAIRRGQELMHAPPAIGAPYCGDVVMI